MENIEFLQAQLSLAGEIAVSHKNNILTDRIFLQISGRKQISAQPVINGTTVQSGMYKQQQNCIPTAQNSCLLLKFHGRVIACSKTVLSI